MALSQTNRAVLDTAPLRELVLEINGFSGGVNTVDEDHAVDPSQARRVENWDATSLGGMIRAKGFNEVVDSSNADYASNPIDLLIQHKDSGGTETFALIKDTTGNHEDLVKKDGTDLSLDDPGDSNAFTASVLSHGVSAGGALWITNSTDNLKRKTIGAAIAAPTQQPAQAYDRIYQLKNRLVVEGGATTANRVAFSRVGTGNWNAADTWTASNDAGSIDLPEDTQGIEPGFPDGNALLTFTKDNCYNVFNIPNAAFRRIQNGHGCSAPLSIARGDEGVYFVSERPTLGIFLYDGVRFIDLTTDRVKDSLVDNINLGGRVFAIYRDRKYHIFFNNASGSAPNEWWIFDARFNRWWERKVSSALSDNMGYPALLRFSNNELYSGSTTTDKIYELETSDNDDEGNDTQAVYTTKDYTSRDFSTASGGAFPIDYVRMKLTKITATVDGTVGAIGVNWCADKGQRTGAKTFDLNADGDLINTTFTVNTSKIIATPPDKTVTKPFNNSAIGRRFNFQFTNDGQSTRGELKKVKIHAVAYDEA